MAKRGSLQGDKALVSTGFGIQSGIVKIVDNRFKIAEWAKKDGSWVGHVLLWQLDVQRSDAKGVVENEDETSQQDLILCWQAKESGQYRFHPGKAKSSGDEDVVDLGSEVGTEGNTFCAPEDAESEVFPFADSPAVLFTKGLEKLGFRKEVNNSAFCPDYNGMVMEVETVQPDVLCKHLGVRYQPPKDGTKVQPQWMIKKVHVFPWDAQKGTSKKPTTGAATSKPNGKAGADEFDLAGYILERAKEVAKDMKGKELTKGELATAVYKKALKVGLATKLHKGLQDYCKSDEGLSALAGEEVLDLVMDEKDDAVIKGVSF